LESITAGSKEIMATTSAACSELIVDFWRSVRRDPTSKESKTFYQSLVRLDSVLRFGYPVTATYLVQLQGIPMELHCRWPAQINADAKKIVSIFWELYQEYLKFRLKNESEIVCNWKILLIE
jgi:hypothetical protein